MRLVIALFLLVSLKRFLFCGMLRESRGYSWRLVSSVSNSIERALHI
mgnify:CR=1 FL=1